jgi:shikimate kinase
MNIVLIGMRGSGKTTIATLLGKKLEREAVEVDKLIAEKEGISISDMVKVHG